jgi:predicted transcriptional regulator
MATVTVSFTLDDEADRAVLKWLACQHRRHKSAAIRSALHTYLSSQDVTLGEIYDAVRDVERKLDSKAGFWTDTVVEDTTDMDEPPDAAAALENLGL